MRDTSRTNERSVAQPMIKVKLVVAQSCPSLCNPMDCSLQVSSVHEILQARMLEWVAISFSKMLLLIKSICAVLSCIQLSVTPWTVVCQAPLSMRFSRQEYWSGLPCSPPGDLLHPGTEPASVSLMSPALVGGFVTTMPPRKPILA